jgi:hypothetical protein
LKRLKAQRTPSPPKIARFFKKNFNSLVSDDPDKPIRIYAPPVELALLIEAIYLHPRADDSFIAEAIEFCSSNGLPPPQISELARAGAF